MNAAQLTQAREAIQARHDAGRLNRAVYGVAFNQLRSISINPTAADSQARWNLLRALLSDEITPEQFKAAVDNGTFQAPRKTGPPAAPQSGIQRATQPSAPQSGIQRATQPPPVPAGPTLREGQVLAGRYRLQKRLGEGGMGQVWLTTDNNFQTDVVVKLLSPRHQHNRIEVDRMKQAFERMHRLKHPQLCPLLDMQMDPRSGHFLVMEYVPGESLQTCQRHTWQQYGKFPLSELGRYLLPIAGALDYLHHNSLIHRDIKPDNILLNQTDSQPRLIDPGLVVTFADAGKPGLDLSGTLPYIAPEQWTGQKFDGRADQYALAVTAYLILSGQLPFYDEDQERMKHLALTGKYPEIARQPPAVNAALDCALSKNPDFRYPDCKSFITELVQANPSSHSIRTPAAPKPKSGVIELVDAVVEEPILLSDMEVANAPPRKPPVRPPAPPRPKPPSQSSPEVQAVPEAAILEITEAEPGDASHSAGAARRRNGVILGVLGGVIFLAVNLVIGYFAWFRDTDALQDEVELLSAEVDNLRQSARNAKADEDPEIQPLWVKAESYRNRGLEALDEEDETAAETSLKQARADYQMAYRLGDELRKLAESDQEAERLTNQNASLLATREKVNEEIAAAREMLKKERYAEALKNLRASNQRLTAAIQVASEEKAEAAEEGGGLEMAGGGDNPGGFNPNASGMGRLARNSTAQMEQATRTSERIASRFPAAELAQAPNWTQAQSHLEAGKRLHEQKLYDQAMTQFTSAQPLYAQTETLLGLQSSLKQIETRIAPAEATLSADGGTRWTAFSSALIQARDDLEKYRQQTSPTGFAARNRESRLTVSIRGLERELPPLLHLAEVLRFVSNNQPEQALDKLMASPTTPQDPDFQRLVDKLGPQAPDWWLKESNRLLEQETSQVWQSFYWMEAGLMQQQLPNQKLIEQTPAQAMEKSLQLAGQIQSPASQFPVRRALLGAGYQLLSRDQLSRELTVLEGLADQLPLSLGNLPADHLQNWHLLYSPRLEAWMQVVELLAELKLTGERDRLFGKLRDNLPNGRNANKEVVSRLDLRSQFAGLEQPEGFTSNRHAPYVFPMLALAGARRLARGASATERETVNRQYQSCVILWQKPVQKRECDHMVNGLFMLAAATMLEQPEKVPQHYDGAQKSLSAMLLKDNDELNQWETAWLVEAFGVAQRWMVRFRLERQELRQAEQVWSESPFADHVDAALMRSPEHSANLRRFGYVAAELGETHTLCAFAQRLPAPGMKALMLLGGYQRFKTQR